MKRTLGRRAFLGRGALVGGCVAACPFLVRGAFADPDSPHVAFDETLGFCCARCTPEDGCAFLSTDPEVKRKKAQELTERLGREVKPEDIRCSRCRVSEETAYEAIRGCSIRQCVIARGLLSCAHCSELDTCESLGQARADRARRVRETLAAPS